MKLYLHQVYLLHSSYHIMTETKKKVPQINKNNKTTPENLMKKEYDESLKELKKEIKEEEETRENYTK